MRKRRLHLEKLDKTPDVVTEFDGKTAIGECYIEREESLYVKLIEVTNQLVGLGADPEDLALHGSFDRFSNWAMQGACYGSDYMHKSEWEVQDLWDQGIYNWKWRLYLNMKMPDNEVRLGNDKFLAVINIVNHEV